ncbi:MAG: hypothetical protein WCP29_18160 [Acidobacteriota bacterium]
MRSLRIVVLPILFMIVMVGCTGSSPAPSAPTASSPTVSSPNTSSPSASTETVSSQAPADPGPCVIGFDDLRVNGSAFATVSACGLTIASTSASWQVSTSYGHPAPFIQFMSPGGTTTTGEIRLTATGGTFGLVSVEIYSSTTKIPYDIAGLAKGAVLFTLSGVQGNTFGKFATVPNPHVSLAIDALQIRLTNPAAPCCANPVGLDNIRITR